MSTGRYNKSEIMKEAHRYYKQIKLYGRTFGEALKMAWASAKSMARVMERIANFQRGLESRRGKSGIIAAHVGMESLYANGAYSGD